MLFSVLMAHYNNSRYLRYAVESVQRQCYGEWEIVLVDDASTDEFEEVILTFADDPRIRIFRTERNCGCGYTKRKCAALATGALAGFLDPDDALTPDALQTMVDWHSAKPQCSLIHSTHFICDQEMKLSRVANYQRALPENTPYLLIGDGSIHAFATFKKALYDLTSGISVLNKKAVDQDLYYLLEEVGEVYFVDRPLYYYRIHSGSISNAGNESKAIINHYAIIIAACSRRIQQLGRHDQVGHYWRKLYRARMCKIRVLLYYRQKRYGRFILQLGLFPFVGGFQNLVSYSKKLPTEGLSLLKKSLVENYEIKV
jgi:glycosyltransferase involved in cell wall biosynthesis